MMILAPLRGVTVRCFRATFAPELKAAGFTEAVTPFVTANPGFDPLSDRELRRPADGARGGDADLPVTPQFIGKDPETLRQCLRRIRSAGYGTADLNCGCPFPMVRNKGRGSGLLRTPDVLRRMLDVGCAEMGPGRFSVKARLGVKAPDELLGLLPILNGYPLRFLTVHARTAVQMYAGACDWEAFRRIAAVAKMPLVANGDLRLEDARRETGDARCGTRGAGRETGDAGCGTEDAGRGTGGGGSHLMIGRDFVRTLGEGEASAERLARYLAASERELSGPGAVLGRMKELLSYWKDLPAWRHRWPAVKIARSVEELRLAAGLGLAT